jgi:hypothetical protein
MITVAIIEDNRLVRKGMLATLDVVAMSEMREVRAPRRESQAQGDRGQSPAREARSVRRAQEQIAHR